MNEYATDTPVTRNEWRTATKALAALSVLMLTGGIAIGASWQRADQAQTTKTGREYVTVNGVNYYPDERTQSDAQPTVRADWTVAPCNTGEALPYTVPGFCIDADGTLTHK